jgi:hypothetical protein
MKISYKKIKLMYLERKVYYISIDNEQYITEGIISRLNISYKDFVQVMKICNAKVIDYKDVFNSEYDDFFFNTKDDIEQAITMLQMLKG